MVRVETSERGTKLSGLKEQTRRKNGRGGQNGHGGQNRQGGQNEQVDSMVRWTCGQNVQCGQVDRKQSVHRMNRWRPDGQNEQGGHIDRPENIDIVGRKDSAGRFKKWTPGPPHVSALSELNSPYSVKKG